jgi:ABC-type transporter Mla maintaining outer membrane lipid asymmetry ATPase subunit MlaF
LKTGQAMTNPEPGILVEIEDVWVRFDGKWVLKSIYLKCYEGEILGIVGPMAAANPRS